MLLSVNLGTTGCKAAVCSLEGRPLGASYIEYPLINLSPQFVEQDANLWWSLSQQVIREAIEAADVDGGCSVAFNFECQQEKRPSDRWAKPSRLGQAVPPAVDTNLSSHQTQG